MPLTEAEMLAAIIGDNAESRNAFLAAFRRTLGAIARDATLVHIRLDQFGATVVHNERVDHLIMYLHVAVNSVVSSTNLLAEGYPLPAGHLMRHYGEATAMTLLFLDQGSGVFEDYKRDPVHFRVDKVLGRLLEPGVAHRLGSLLSLDPSRWKQFIAISRFYNHFSHAGAVSMAFHFPLGKPNRLIIGAHYDPVKRHSTALELERRRSALKTLDTLVRILSRELPRAPRRKKSAKPPNIRLTPTGGRPDRLALRFAPGLDRDTL